MGDKTITLDFSKAVPIQKDQDSTKPAVSLDFSKAVPIANNQDASEPDRPGFLETVGNGLKSFGHTLFDPPGSHMFDKEYGWAQGERAPGSFGGRHPLLPGEKVTEAHPVDMPEWEQVAESLPLVAPIMRIVRGSASQGTASAGQVQPLVEQGRYSEAVGHGLAAAVPGGGLAEASGEAFGKGNTAEGLGNAALALAPYGMHEAAPLVPPALQKTGQAVVKAAPIVGNIAGKAASYGGPLEFLHSPSPSTFMGGIVGPAIAPYVKQAATSIVKGGGNLMIKAGDALAPKVPPASIFDAPTSFPDHGSQPLQTPMPTDVASPSSFSPSNTTSTPVPKPLKATSPKTAQTEVLRNMGIAAPSATVKPMTKIPTGVMTPRPDLSFAGSNSGESAAMNQLSENFSPDRLGINDLRGIAQSRGIKVEPGDNHQVIIGKIHDSLSPDELDRFEQAATERMQPNYSIPSTIAPPQ
jgi:hypothetical protein